MHHSTWPCNTPLPSLKRVTTSAVDNDPLQEYTVPIDCQYESSSDEDKKEAGTGVFPKEPWCRLACQRAIK